MSSGERRRGGGGGGGGGYLDASISPRGSIRLLTGCARPNHEAGPLREASWGGRRLWHILRQDPALRSSVQRTPSVAPLVTARYCTRQRTGHPTPRRESPRAFMIPNKTLSPPTNPPRPSKQTPLNAVGAVARVQSDYHGRQPFLFLVLSFLRSFCARRAMSAWLSSCGSADE